MGGLKQTSEKIAGASLAVMTIPAFLAFPILGVWYCAKVWPVMTWVDRGLFFFAVSFLCVALTRLLRTRRASVLQGHVVSPTATDIALVNIPMLIGAWALTHNTAALIGMSAYAIFSVRTAANSQKLAREDPKKNVVFPRSTQNLE